jgi:hypothetical protein
LAIPLKNVQAWESALVKPANNAFESGPPSAAAQRER